MNANQKTDIALALGLSLCSALIPAHADEQDAVATPYRPTVSNPAELSAPGWLGIELGWQRLRGGGDHQRDSLPLTFKLAFSDDWGILLGTEADVRRTDLDHARHTGMGDATVLLKHRLGGDPAQAGAWGIEAGAKAPTAKDTIGSGKSDYLINLIYSADRLGNRIDLNVNGTRLGAIGEGEGRLQYGWAASLSRALDERWTLFGELSGAYRRATSAYSQFMAGASYNLSKRMVLDAGAARGLTDGAQDWTAFAGITVLTARLW